MTNDIADAIRSAHSLTRLLKSCQGMTVYGELMQAATDLQESLSQALLNNATSAEQKMTLLSEKEALAEENKKLKNWSATASDYKLENLGYGSFAQVYKPKIHSSKPPHWACTNCFEEQVISILQNKPRSGYCCHRCKLELSPHYTGNKHPS